MNYFKFVISVADKYQEPLIAELEEMGFVGYQQLEGGLIAYILQKDLQIRERERIDQLLAAYPGDNFIQSEEIVDEKNWNREWEKTVEAVSVDDFLIKPTWSTQPAEGDQILLEIDPKMAFGTGYHATTRLILKMLSEMTVTGKKVLDAGTGTGILAIAAAKMGAECVIAFDMDEWSIQNSHENILLNGVEDKVEVRQGSIDVVKKEGKFDFVLANINKNAIVIMLNRFTNLLGDKGILLLSGLLKEDEKEIKTHLKKNNLKLVKTEQEEEWMLLEAKKI